MSSWDAITADFSQVFKKLFVISKLGGSKDYFKSRNFRGQKLSRVKKTAKFME